MNKTKRAIFDAAIKEFSGNGYTGTSVDSIAIEAGVAKGTLYYHFKSKEEIFNFIITHGMEELTHSVEGTVLDGEDILGSFRQICREQLGLVHQNKNFFKVVMSQLWGQELRHLQLREAVRKYIQVIEEKLKIAEQKDLIKHFDDSFMAYYFFGTLCSTAVYEIVNSDTDVDRTIDKLIDLLLNGIKK